MFNKEAFSLKFESYFCLVTMVFVIKAAPLSVYYLGSGFLIKH